MNNTAGFIRSTQDMTVSTGTSELTNRDSGEHGGIFSAGQLTLNTGALNNRDGVLTGRADVTVTAGSTDNSNGILGSQSGSLGLQVNGIQNAGGLLQAQ
ncbi:hypothetical protein, partial [Salmonella enterica]|uniref:hypothetical protein n=1 Tax=Salmonella enterica TaxID=28901 RepID=UPI0032E364AA